jgi:hypothetical protein
MIADTGSKTASRCTPTTDAHVLRSEHTNAASLASAAGSSPGTGSASVSVIPIHSGKIGESDGVAATDSIAEGDADTEPDSIAEGDADTEPDSIAEGDTDTEPDSIAEGDKDTEADGPSGLPVSLIKSRAHAQSHKRRC